MLASSVHAQTVNTCQSKKKTCVAKKEAALLKCHATAEKKGVAVDALCLQTARDKFGDPSQGCFAKLEAKGGCLTTSDAAALEAKVDAFVDDTVTTLDPTYPAVVLNKCSAGKKQCVANKAKALLKCHAKAERTGTLDATCVQKAKDKFGDPVKGCFAKLEAKGACLTLGDTATLETKVDVFVNRVVCALDPASPACTACPTASTYQFTSTGTATDSDLGWTGLAHDNRFTSNVRFTVAIGSCTNPSAPCGSCSVSGRIANAGPDLQYRRCLGDDTGANGSWIHCATNADCPGTGNACISYAGPPQPETVGGISVCSLYDFAGPITGTVNLETGDTTMPATIGWRLFLGLIEDDPCPKCAGTCTSGQRSGQPCTVDGHSALFADDVSLDCPPSSDHIIGQQTLATTLATGSQTFTLSAASPSCRALGFTASKCLCDTCNNAAATPCHSNADCTAVGASVCGGNRCAGGDNDGTPCGADSDCTGGGGCGVPGLPTKPNPCNDHVCTPNPLDTDSTGEGICAAGPSETFCSIETYRGCLVNSDCPLPGDSCNIVGRLRECFTDNGTIGGSTSVGGVASTTAPILGALTCVPPAASVAVNNAYGLPGAGRFTLPGTAVIN